MEGCLVHDADTAQARKLHLKKRASVTFGSDRTCTVVLRTEGFKPKHAVMSLEGDSIVLRNLDEEGTRVKVNDTAVKDTPVPIKDGDRINFENCVVLRYQSADTLSTSNSNPTESDAQAAGGQPTTQTSSSDSDQTNPPAAGLPLSGSTDDTTVASVPIGIAVPLPPLPSIAKDESATAATIKKDDEDEAKETEDEEEGEGSGMDTEGESSGKRAGLAGRANSKRKRSGEEDEEGDEALDEKKSFSLALSLEKQAKSGELANYQHMSLAQALTEGLISEGLPGMVDVKRDQDGSLCLLIRFPNVIQDTSRDEAIALALGRDSAVRRSDRLARQPLPPGAKKPKAGAAPAGAAPTNDKKKVARAVAPSSSGTKYSTASSTSALRSRSANSRPVAITSKNRGMTKQPRVMGPAPVKTAGGSAGGSLAGSGGSSSSSGKNAIDPRKGGIIGKKKSAVAAAVAAAANNGAGGATGGGSTGGSGGDAAEDDEEEEEVERSAAGPKKSGKGTLLWSAERVLQEEGKPMKACDIIAKGREKGYIETDSKGAANSLVGRFSTSIRTDPHSPFIRVAAATYGLKVHEHLYRLDKAYRDGETESNSD